MPWRRYDFPGLSQFFPWQINMRIWDRVVLKCFFEWDPFRRDLNDLHYVFHHSAAVIGRNLDTYMTWKEYVKFTVHIIPAKGYPILKCIGQDVNQNKVPSTFVNFRLVGFQSFRPRSTICEGRVTEGDEWKIADATQSLLRFYQWKTR